MNAEPTRSSSNRILAVLWANTWGFNFLIFALLLDIMYRSFVFHEAPWDLFALLGLSGIVCFVYAARHNVWILNFTSAIVIAASAVVAAIVAAIVALTRIM